MDPRGRRRRAGPASLRWAAGCGARRAGAASAAASAASPSPRLPPPVGGQPAPREEAEACRGALMPPWNPELLQRRKAQRRGAPEAALDCSACRAEYSTGAGNGIPSRPGATMQCTACFDTRGPAACRRPRDAKGVVRNAARRHVGARVQSGGARGTDVGSKKTAIATNAKSGGMTAGRAAACALADRRSRRRGYSGGAGGGAGWAAGCGGARRRRRHGRLLLPGRRRSDRMTAGRGRGGRRWGLCAPPHSRHDRPGTRRRSPALDRGGA